MSFDFSPHCCGPPACLLVGADAAGAGGGWKGLAGKAGSASQRDAAAAKVTSLIPWCGNGPERVVLDGVAMVLDLSHQDGCPSHRYEL